MLLSHNEFANACNWLLVNAGSAIRYRTLTELLHRAPDEEPVQMAYSEILNSERLKFISTKQNADGSLGQWYFHGQDTTEPYLRELFELCLKPDHMLIAKGLEYIKSIYKNHIASWIIGLFEEPLGRAGKSELVVNWFKEYMTNFNDLYTDHRSEWLYTRKDKPTTDYYPGIPFIYVIRTISGSWQWLKDIAGASDITRILDFLLVDMANVDDLYWNMSTRAGDGPGASIPNRFYIVSSDYITNNIPGGLEFALMLEELWLLAEFGVIENYPCLKRCFRYISSIKNDDGIWEFPIKGITKSKSMWHASHGFSLEENWRKRQSQYAELTFRVCLIDEKNRAGKEI